MPPPLITLRELYQMRQDKQKNRTLCFDKVVELCHRRIRNVASYGGLNTFYEVPGMLVGYPLFRVQDATAYLIEALRKVGFLVQVLPPPHVAVVYISWDPQELRPSRPALMPAATAPAAKPAKKSGGGVRPIRDADQRLRLF